MVSFLRVIENHGYSYVSEKLSRSISLVMESYLNRKIFVKLYQ